MAGPTGSLNKVLSGIDNFLYQPAGEFRPVTYAVDDLTIKADSSLKKRGWQCLTYFSRPIDCIIQLIISPVLAIYQTGKSCYKSFTKDDITKTDIAIGVGKVLISPLICAGKLLLNISTTQPLSVVVGLIPYKVAMDVFHDFFKDKPSELDVVHFSDRFEANGSRLTNRHTRFELRYKTMFNYPLGSGCWFNSEYSIKKNAQRFFKDFTRSFVY